MNKRSLSVIICTHNPKIDYLERTLASLRVQTLPADRWELRIIDNASTEPIADKIDLTWHPDAAIVCEDELGLTLARVRAINTVRTNCLVFFDDDNVAQEDYLEQVLKLTEAHPYLGAWSGNIALEYEIPPPEYANESMHLLLFRKAPEALWVYCPGVMPNYRFVPWGAGICVRREVATAWVDLLSQSASARGLGRRGSSLLGGEDLDMALTSFKCGLAMGTFPQLKLTHLIPAHRLRKTYLLRLSYSNGYSHEKVMQLHQSNYQPSMANFNLLAGARMRFHRLRNRFMGKLSVSGSFRLQCQVQEFKGRAQAAREWNVQLQRNNK